MSRNIYLLGLKIAAEDYPFYALIQAAMRYAEEIEALDSEFA